MDKDEIIAEIKDKFNLINDKDIVAVYLFGSVSEEKSGHMSDIDVCVIGSNISQNEKFKIMGLFDDRYDISFFNDMPVWIKIRVLKGVPVIINDRAELYDISFRTLDEYEDFKPLVRNRIMGRFGKCMI